MHKYRIFVSLEGGERFVFECMAIIYTIGHSNHEPDEFLRLLRVVKVDVLVDVRSNPNSSWADFAKKDNLTNLLKSSGIRYVYMGDMLGGYPSEEECYDPRTGKADYALIREREPFKRGIARLLNGSRRYTICIMCAEENPAHCHRSLLVANALSQRGANILHIRGDGHIQTDEELSKERAGVPANQQKLPL